jgi:nucleoside-diphosphate-sugar epimerase
MSFSEIFPFLGSPSDRGFLDKQDDLVFVVVSNTEDFSNYEGHFSDVLKVLRLLGQLSVRKTGVKPLVMFTSGCKDYGRTARHGSTELHSHTEESPLHPLDILVPRTETTVKLLNGSENEPFDAVVLWPTTVYGYGSSYYGLLFAFAEQAKDKGLLRIPAHPNTIMHGAHVDDCAEAYVLLASYSDRKAIRGQAFNISNARYETVGEISEALARSYGLKVEYDLSTGEKRDEDIVPGSIESIVGFSQ